MKHGSAYAAKVKRLFNKLRREQGKPDPAEQTDPVEQTVLAILSRDTSDSRATKALSRLRATTVDLNDLRVTTMPDIVEVLGESYPDAQGRARDIRESLRDIFNRESILDLDFLRDRARREARQYLESLAGVDAYVVASVMLWSLGGHAIPVDNQLLEVLKRNELVGPRADRAEVQAFLEHHISAADAQAFTTLIHRYAAAHASRTPTAAPEAPAKTRRASARRTNAAAKAKAATPTQKSPASVKKRPKGKSKTKKLATASRTGKKDAAKTQARAKASRPRRKTTARR